MKVRFAPSPSGSIHIGNAMIAVQNWQACNKVQKDFILRIDDTCEKVSDNTVQNIKNDINWLGIQYGEVHFQSERKHIYYAAFKKLLHKKLIYPCCESKEELNEYRKNLLKNNLPPIYKKKRKESQENILLHSKNLYWRYQLPNQKISWKDRNREITIDLNTLSDPIILTSKENFSYIFASAIDDSEMKIKKVLRGEDHITNTAIQICIIKHLQGNLPEWEHFPLLFDKNGENFSKRKNSFSIYNLKKEGFHKNAISNILLKNNISRQCFSLNDLKKENKKILFSLKKPQTTSLSEKQWSIVRENILSLNEVSEWEDIFLNESLFFKKWEYLPPKEICPINILNNLQELSLQCDKKSLYKKLRFCLIGKEKGPSIKEIIENLPIKILKNRLYGSV